MIEKPTTINILGTVYKVKYKDKPSDVDLFKRQSLWGQVDYWTRTIRVYDNDNPVQDVWHTILHEVLHAIASELHVDEKFSDEDELVDLVALALVDVLVRNGWMEIEG